MRGWSLQEGSALALWALIALPLGRRTRREWLTANLDVATILFAATIFMWHFSFRPSLSGARVDASVLTRLVLALPVHADRRGDVSGSPS
jgi:hypothetical protein